MSLFLSITFFHFVHGADARKLCGVVGLVQGSSGYVLAFRRGRGVVGHLRRPSIQGRSGAERTKDADKQSRKGRSGAEGSMGPRVRNGRKEVEPE